MAIGFQGLAPLFGGGMGGLQMPMQDVPGLQRPLPPPTNSPNDPYGEAKSPSKLWSILGVVGDAMQTMDGGRATFAPMLMEMQERERQERAAIAKRQQDWEDWRQREQWKRDNPTPNQPDMFTRMLEGAGIPQGSPEARGLYRKRAEMLTNPVQLVPDGLGGYKAVRPNETGGGIQPGHTEDGYTFMGGDPGDPNNWKQGGAAPSATAPFPIP